MNGENFNLINLKKVKLFLKKGKNKITLSHSIFLILFLILCLILKELKTKQKG
jgi:hypothetical protein